MVTRLRNITLPRTLDVAIVTIGVAMVIYQVIGALLHPLGPVPHVTTHLLFALILVFLTRSQTVRKYRTVAAISILLTVVSMVYIYIFSNDLQIRAGAINTTDMVIGIIIVLIILESNRVSQGIVLPIFTALFIAYAFLGQYITGMLGHAPIAPERVISWLGIGLTTGIYSSILYISANMIFMFILFGSILEATGGREFFIQVGLLVGRRIRGGAAQTSAISSGLVGSVTGSSVANVALTGAVTIPLMKKTGFRPEMAAAVEAAASSGGMLMPPVMGAVAFIMSGLTGIPYIKIVIMALIPALLYYAGISVGAYLYARREHIPRVEAQVDKRLLLRRAPLFIIPFTLIMVLLVQRYSPGYAAAWSILVTLVISLFQKDTRPKLRALARSLAHGAVVASEIAVMTALIGIIIAMMSMTSLSATLASQVEVWGFGSLLFTLLMAMVVSLFLGMASPITGSYVIVALIVAPVLTRMGVSLAQAHMFALYFSVIGFITPPVAPAAIVAAQMAEAPLMRTALNAFRLVVSGILIPFIFIYDSALLGMFEHGVLMGLLSIGVVILLMVSLSILLFNYYLTKLNFLDVLLALGSTVALLGYFFAHNSSLMLVGGGFFLALTLWQLMRSRRLRPAGGEL